MDSTEREAAEQLRHHAEVASVVLYQQWLVGAPDVERETTEALVDLGATAEMYFQNVEAGTADLLQAFGYAARAEWLISQIIAPQALARVRSIREALGRRLAPWSRAAFEAVLKTVARVASQGQPFAGTTRALQLHAFAEVAGDAYPEADVDRALATFEVANALAKDGATEKALQVMERARRQFVALSHAGSPTAQRLEARARSEQGHLLFSLGRYEEAIAAHEESGTRCEALGIPFGAALAYMQIGLLRIAQERFDEALVASEEALKRFDALGMPDKVSATWAQLGMAHAGAKRYEAAAQAYEQTWVRELRIGNRSYAAIALGERGHALRNIGWLEEAAEAHRKAAELYEEVGDATRAALEACHRGVVLQALGRLDDARSVLHAALPKAQAGDASERFRPWAALAEVERRAGKSEAACLAYAEATNAYFHYRRSGGALVDAGAKWVVAVMVRLVEQGPEAASALLQTIPLDAPELGARPAATVHVLKRILAGDRDPALIDDPDIAPSCAVEMLALLDSMPPPPPFDVQAAWDESNRLYEELSALPSRGTVDVAISLAERALELREKALGPEHSRVAVALDVLALQYVNKGDFATAEPLMLRAISIWEKEHGGDHPEVSNSVHFLANMYLRASDYAKAEPLFLRTLSIRERALGSEHPDVARALVGLAQVHGKRGAYSKAEEVFYRAISIQEKVLGPEHLELGISLNELANLYTDLREHGKAEALYRRVISIQEKVDPSGARMAFGLGNLAEIHRLKGEYLEAEPLYQRALSIREKLFGHEHRDVAQSLNNLALLHQAKNDFPKAEELLLRALAIWEKVLGPEHIEVAVALNNLGRVYKEKGDAEKAAAAYRRALAIRKKTFGPEHPSVAESLNNLALLHGPRSDDAEAEALLLDAVAIGEKSLGPEHPALATWLQNLGALYSSRGDHEKAEPLFLRALAIQDEALGPMHPDVVTSLLNLGTLYLDRGRAPEALQRMARAAAIQDRNAALLLTIGSDKRKRIFMNSLRLATYQIISLHTRFLQEDEDAKRLALTTILNRKGRVLGAMTDTFTTLRRRLGPADQERLDQLRATTDAILECMLSDPSEASTRDLRRLDEEREKLEDDISRRGALLQGELQPIDLTRVAREIPEGATLVEICGYIAPGATSISPGDPRYVAYVLRRDGDIAWVDLGSAETINAAVTRLLRAFSRPVADARPIAAREFDLPEGEALADPLAARELDRLVMEPIRRLLGATERVFLCPDFELNLVPFAALVDEDGRYLVERYALTYLTSGRDLLRLGESLPSRAGPAVVAAPDYDAAGAAVASAGNAGSDRPPTTRGIRFHPLHFAAQEGHAITRKVVGSTFLTSAEASKRALQKLGGPHLLHIATHGFYLQPPPGLRETDVPRMSPEDSLLLSGLALAGANGPDGVQADGIMTALEVSQLDLDGTKLVTLSACVTGVGNVQSGDGVYGLRRALVMAGAETQVMSLWSVDDAATSELMEAFYDKLLSGLGRGEALRKTQIEMLRRPERAHPFYWASFIVSGNDSPMEAWAPPH